MLPLTSGSSKPINLQEDDIFVIVSFFWEPFVEYQDIVRRAQSAGARVFVFVHDLIPALYPSLMMGEFVSRFTACLSFFQNHADAIITLSESSSAEISRFFAQGARPSCSPDIRWFHMGADAVDVTPTSRSSSDRLTAIFGRKTFLTVGTLIPHKGAPLAIKAFEQVWNAGIDVNYLLIGHEDTYWRSIPETIRGHREYGKRLHWFADMEDGELAQAYTRSYCYIQPSIDEGFGIPLAEAASHGLPIIASDIPVFREIGTSDVQYFRTCDAADLARAILSVDVRRPVAPKIAMRSWRDSFLRLCEILEA